MYSRMAGTGSRSASTGSQSRAASRRPSDMGIQASSIVRMRAETSSTIGAESIPAFFLCPLPLGALGRDAFGLAFDLRLLADLFRATERQTAGEIITAEATGARRLDPLGIDGIGPPEAVDEGGEAEEDILRQRLSHELAQREHDVGFEAAVQHLLQPGEAGVAPDLEPEGEPSHHGIRQEMPAREAAVDDRMQSGQRG